MLQEEPNLLLMSRSGRGGARRRINSAQAVAALVRNDPSLNLEKENFYEPNVGLYDGPFRELDESPEAESDIELSSMERERQSGGRARPLTSSSGYNSMPRSLQSRNQRSRFPHDFGDSQQQMVQSSWIASML